MNLYASGITPLIGVVTGTWRHGRLGDVPAHWLHRLAGMRNDVHVELIDLGNVPFPTLDQSAGLDTRAARRDGAGRWTRAFKRLDGVIVVVPDDGTPTTGAFMRTDSLVEALSQKPVAFVTFGGRSAAPLRQQLRDRASRLGMAPMPQSVYLTGYEVASIRDMQRDFEDFPHLGQMAQDMLDELCRQAHALAGVRGNRALATDPVVPRTRLPESVVGHAMHGLRQWIDEVCGTASQWNPRAVERAPPWAR